MHWRAAPRSGSLRRRWERAQSGARERGGRRKREKIRPLREWGRLGTKGHRAARWEPGKDKTGNMIMVTCGRAARADRHDKGKRGSKKAKGGGEFPVAWLWRGPTRVDPGTFALQRRALTTPATSGRVRESVKRRELEPLRHSRFT